MSDYIPRIYVRLNRMRSRLKSWNTNGIYRVKWLVGQGDQNMALVCLDQCGKRYHLYLTELYGLMPIECTFFRGPAAELLHILDFSPRQRTESQDAILQANWMKEVHCVIPPRLWSDIEAMRK